MTSRNLAEFTASCSTANVFRGTDAFIARLRYPVPARVGPQPPGALAAGPGSYGRLALRACPTPPWVSGKPREPRPQNGLHNSLKLTKPGDDCRKLVTFPGT